MGISGARRGRPRHAVTPALLDPHLVAGEAKYSRGAASVRAGQSRVANSRSGPCLRLTFTGPREDFTDTMDGLP